jgi:hypothetical protein
METPLAERAGWIKARMPRRVTAEDWRAIAAFRLLTQPWLDGERPGSIHISQDPIRRPERGLSRSSPG